MLITPGMFERDYKSAAERKKEASDKKAKTAYARARAKRKKRK